ncbi:MAG: hypothetical protein GEV12_11365 [Micromonosporaceae bacterium]|nr:hypothetical protein [Micromonosporaceae bacterium]
MARHARWPAAAAVVGLVVVAAGCTPEPDEPELSLRDGGADLVSWWPLRGSLTGNDDTRAEVTGVVGDWRTPDGVASHDTASGLLWLGEVDGAVLAVVDFHPADQPDRSWLLELAGPAGEVAVTDARSYDGPLLDEDILPVRSAPAGPRYLASERIATVTAQVGELSLTDGLTAPVEVPQCQVTEVSARLGSEEHRRLDLGLDLPAPFYPLLREGYAGVPAAPLLDGVDTCAAMAPDGWLGAVGEPDGQPAVRIGGFPAIRRLGAEELPDQSPPGRLVSVHAEYVPVSGGVRLAEWLLWTYPTDGAEAVSGVELPPDAAPAATGAGLLVTPLPDQPLEIGYTQDGEQHQLTVPASSR